MVSSQTGDEVEFCCPYTEYYAASYETSGGVAFLLTGGIYYNASQSQNTDAQKLFGYTGGYPGTITSGPDFEVAATTYKTDAFGNWQSEASTCKGIVNIKIQ